MEQFIQFPRLILFSAHWMEESHETMEGSTMATSTNADPKDKMEHPQAHYKTPDEITNDNELNSEQRKKALDTWEQDARQMLTASNEGMAGSEEGIARGERNRFGEVVRAKAKIGEN
jgi:hypothetical protein